MIKALVVLPGRALNHFVVRRIGLNNRAPGPAAPAGPSHHLGQQIKSLLRSPVVVHIKGNVRREHAYQRHILKIQSLGHHLSTQENRNVFLLKSIQDHFMSVGNGVGIHPQNTDTR